MERRELNVQVRDKTGKGIARKLRQTGKIPAVFYGPGTQTVPLSLERKLLYKALDTKSGLNTLIDLRCESQGINGRTVMLKDYQADPLTEEYIHADFIEVNLNKPLTVSVPLYLHGVPEGVTKGGVLEQILWEVEISTLPELIPDEFVVDVSKMEIGDTLHVSNIERGEKIEMVTPEDEAVATISVPRLAEEAAAEAEIAEGEEAEAEEEGATEGEKEEKTEE